MPQITDLQLIKESGLDQLIGKTIRAVEIVRCEDGSVAYELVTDDIAFTYQGTKEIDCTEILQC